MGSIAGTTEGMSLSASGICPRCGSNVAVDAAYGWRWGRRFGRRHGRRGRGANRWGCRGRREDDDCPLTSTGTTIPRRRNLRLAQDDDHGEYPAASWPGFSVLGLADAE